MFKFNKKKPQKRLQVLYKLNDQAIKVHKIKTAIKVLISSCSEHRVIPSVFWRQTRRSSLFDSAPTTRNRPWTSALWRYGEVAGNNVRGVASEEFLRWIYILIFFSTIAQLNTGLTLFNEEKLAWRYEKSGSVWVYEKTINMSQKINKNVIQT